tara:strand:- start:482 stop:652 length:171 start_codon:yes stop_codon:yes gene_type:complete
LNRAVYLDTACRKIALPLDNYLLSPFDYMGLSQLGQRHNNIFQVKKGVQMPRWLSL